MKRVAGAILCAGLVWVTNARSQDHAHEHMEPEHQHAAAPTPASASRAQVPAPTDADRAAATAPRGGHVMDDNRWNGMLTVDRLESWEAADDIALAWQADSWVGTDTHRLWVRTEGTRVDADTRHATVEALAARSVATWWDVVAGVRHDFGIPSHRDYLAAGVQGVAPYWIHIAATAYLGEHSRSAARIEISHDLLLTNRLVLQSNLQTDLAGRDDDDNAVAAGVSTLELGLRLRYEITRRFAPYAGLSHERAVAATAGMRRDLGTEVGDTRIVLGLRTWF